MHSKYNNMHKNEMFYALIYVNNHILECVNCMLSKGKKEKSKRMKEKDLLRSQGGRRE